LVFRVIQRVQCVAQAQSTGVEQNTALPQRIVRV
jgi:hypothetical protein